MTDLFLKLVNMSIAASWLVLAVLVLRFVLKKAPKWVNVLLWGLVAVRLICPFTPESALSLIPSSETIPPQIMSDPAPTIQSGIHAINSTVNPIISQSLAPAPGASANPLQIWMPIAALFWITGMALMLVYTLISYLRLHRRVKTAVRLRENIFQSEQVLSPFVLGIVSPRIYLPFGMNGQDMEHVLAHERAHIRRRDHWWKPLGFALLTLHWFNPLLWVAYILLCRDIELACDEKVIRGLGCEQRADYSQALLSCSVNHTMIAACPLAFGEVSVKARVKSVLNYRRSAFWIVAIAVLACIAAAVCFLTDPKVPDELPVEPGGNSSLLPALDALPDDYSLEQAKLDGCVVMEDGDVTTGQDIWQTFCSTARSGKAAAVRYVSYYTLGDPNRYDSAYYESIKDRYPVMYIHDLIFDGTSYTVRWYEDGAPITRSYRYLMRYEGVPTSPHATYKSHIRYVLTNQNDVTWEDIFSGMVSSQLGDYIDHLSVYTDLIYGGEPAESGAGRLSPGTYVPVRCVYMSPASSYSAFNLSGDFRYTVTQGSFITDYLSSGGSSTVAVDWQWQTMDEAEPALSSLKKNKHWFYFTLHSGCLYQKLNAGHFLIQDGPSLYLVQLGDSRSVLTQVFSIYELVKTDATDIRIIELLSAIRSSPLHMSAPGAYIEEHEAEYRELLSYGEDTLRYCFAAFLRGGQTDLNGYIMALACQDILADRGEAPIIETGFATGQEWFDHFLSLARFVQTQYSEADLKTHYPASWLVLQLAGEG